MPLSGARNSAGIDRPGLPPTISGPGVEQSGAPAWSEVDAAWDPYTPVGRDPGYGSRPTGGVGRRSGHAPYDVVAAVDLVLADPGTGVRRVVHVATARVYRGVVAVRAGAEDDQVTDLLAALADGLTVPLLRVGLVRQLLAHRLAVDVHREAGAVEPAGAGRGELVQSAGVPLGLSEDLRALVHLGLGNGHDDLLAGGGADHAASAVGRAQRQRGAGPGDERDPAGRRDLAGQPG